MLKNLVSTGRTKIVLLTAIVFSMVVVTLGITPNYSCGCGGEFRNGTQLTHLINGVSKNVIGKKIFKTDNH